MAAIHKSIVGEGAVAEGSGTDVCKNQENDRFAYGQLCDSYRAIDDFRTKLLTLLPIGTGIFLVLPELAKGVGDAAKTGVAQNFLQTLSPAVGLFGMAVAIGLFVLELYGIRKCTHLIEAGKALERRLDVAGQFRRRAPELFGFIAEPFAAGVIYPAVIAAWAFVGLNDVPEMRGPVGPIAIFAVFFISSLAFIHWLHSDAEELRIKAQGAEAGADKIPQARDGR